MARRGREAALKRAREKARQDKQEAKRERRAARDAEDPSSDSVDEQALMEQFAQLSERHEADQISTQQYAEERHRIFVELGIESD
ncbi:MAG TPA: hypothetical protein VF115_09670, partial [Acidimicrobiia bacterium]